MTEENNNQELSELEKCQKERDEYLNNWKKERADFLNYKKDEVKRLEEFVKFANEAVILEVIEVLDDLERAAKEVKNEGLDQVLKKFQDLLKKYGIEKIRVEGTFDPLLHEAVGTAPMPEGVGVPTEFPRSAWDPTPGTEASGKEEEKIEEVRAGYTMHGKIIRPARVKILNSLKLKDQRLMPDGLKL